MARGNDRGKDFDDQFNESRRRGQEKAARGESHWAQDKYLERINQQSRGPAHHAGESKGCSDKTVILLALLGGAGWVFTEVVGRFV